MALTSSLQETQGLGNTYLEVRCLNCPEGTDVSDIEDVCFPSGWPPPITVRTNEVPGRYRQFQRAQNLVKAVCERIPDINDALRAGTIKNTSPSFEWKHMSATPARLGGRDKGSGVQGQS